MPVKDIVLKIRLATKLDQKDFARLAHLYRSSVSQFETGVRTPRPHHALKYLIISKKFKLKFKLEDFYKE